MTPSEAFSTVGTSVGAGGLLALVAVCATILIVVLTAAPLVYITVLKGGPSHRRLCQFLKSLAKVIEAWRSGPSSRGRRNKGVPAE